MVVLSGKTLLQSTPETWGVFTVGTCNTFGITWQLAPKWTKVIWNTMPQCFCFSVTYLKIEEAPAFQTGNALSLWSVARQMQRQRARERSQIKKKEEKITDIYKKNTKADQAENVFSVKKWEVWLLRFIYIHTDTHIGKSVVESGPFPSCYKHARSPGAKSSWPCQDSFYCKSPSFFSHVFLEPWSVFSDRIWASSIIALSWPQLYLVCICAH